MKNITKSVAMIAVVAALAIGGTVAYFSDEEVSTGNTITAGTIDISVDGENPWSKTYLQSLPDFKPGVKKEITFKVKNEGSNPAVIRKMLSNYVLTTGMNEPKCVALLGTWSGGACDKVATEDITKVILYDMSVSADGGSTWTDVILGSWNIHMSDVNSLYAPLGTLQPSAELMVKQSYKLEETADNTYQGDKVVFDINLYAEQLNGPGPKTTTGVVLENKNTTTWDVVVDGTWGILTWDGSGNYTLKAFGMNSSLNYNLVYWDGSSEHVISGPYAPVSGNVNETGIYAGFSANSGAKYWLRPTPWSSSSDANTLYEGNVVN